MKTVTFKRAASLGEGESRKDFPIGTHRVPAEMCAGWFFDALKKDGAIVVSADEADAEADAAEGTAATTAAAILAGAAKDVVKALDEAKMGDEALLELLEAEQAGKNRATVVAKLTELIEAQG